VRGVCLYFDHSTKSGENCGVTFVLSPKGFLEGIAIYLYGWRVT